MKVLKIIGVLLLVVVLALIAWGATLPNTNHVEREIVINTSADALYQELTSFKGFNEWSPWFTIDPEGTEYTYEGPDAGLGAVMSWTSDHPDVGSGRQEIIEVVENELIKNRMDFGYQGDYYASFILSPEQEQTKVVWSYDAENLGLMSRLMGNLINVEEMVGGSYENGLLALKEMMESRPVEVVVEETMAADTTVVEQ